MNSNSDILGQTKQLEWPLKVICLSKRITLRIFYYKDQHTHTNCLINLPTPNVKNNFLTSHSL